MKKYLAVISSEQFDTLYRFGKLYHPIFLSTEDQDEKSVIEIFNSFIQFVYDENYLVLEYIVPDVEEKPFHLIKIENIERIFPISNECREALVLKKSSKIKFENPFFSNSAYEKINHEYFISEAIGGSSILLKTFKYENESVQLSSEIKSAVLKLRKGLKIGRLDNKATIVDFCFLYVYEAYYPLNIIGYMIRTAEIFTRYKLAEKNVQYSPDILEKRDIYQMLIELNSKQTAINFDKLLDELTIDSRATNFTSNLIVDNLKYYIVILLFLKTVDEFNENGGTLDKTNLNKIIENYHSVYSEECKMLLTWLGSYLGYGNCYDFCYNKLNLKIFTTYKSIDLVESKTAEIINSEIHLIGSTEANQMSEISSNENAINNKVEDASEISNSIDDDINNELDGKAEIISPVIEEKLNNSMFEIISNENAINNKVEDASEISNSIDDVNLNNELDGKAEIISPVNNKGLPLEFLPLDQLKLEKAGFTYVKKIWLESMKLNQSNDEQVNHFISIIEKELTISKKQKQKIKFEEFERIKSFLLINN